MGANDIGIEQSDFTNNALSDFGVQLSWEDCTKTNDNITGDETLSYSTAVLTTAVFVKRSQRYEQTAEGLVDLGDAYIMSPISLGFAKNDRITYEGEIFLINEVIRRRANGINMFDKCTLIKTED